MMGPSLRRLLIFTAIALVPAVIAGAQEGSSSLQLPAESAIELPGVDDSLFDLPLGEDVSATDLSNQPESAEDVTADIVTSAIAGFPTCLAYCIVGLDLRFKLTPSITLLITPYVSHNNADFVVQTYPRLTEEPWLEWAATVGPALVEVTDPIARLLGTFNGLGGGDSRVVKYGRQQSHRFKEADVIGSPYVVVPTLLEGGELAEESDECETRGCLEDGDDAVGEQISQNLDDPEENGGSEETSVEELYSDAEESVGEQLADYTERLEECTEDLECLIGYLTRNTEFSRVFSLYEVYQDIAEAIETLQTLMEILEIVETVVTVISTVIQGYTASIVDAEFVVDRILCKSDVIPFTPYYLSGLDALFWRPGFPVSDPFHALEVLNPFSKDRIGPEGELWSHIYPRIGFVDHEHDAKVGATTAIRAMDIVQEGPRRRLRWNETGEARGLWQMFYPHDRECIERPDLDPYRNLMGDFMYPGEEYRYAWHYWREQVCTLSEQGARLAIIPFELCLL